MRRFKAKSHVGLVTMLARLAQSMCTRLIRNAGDLRCLEFPSHAPDKSRVVRIAKQNESYKALAASLAAARAAARSARL